MSVPLQVLRDSDARNLNVSTVVTVLSMMVSGGSAGGFLLKSMIISTVLSLLSSRLLKAGTHQANFKELAAVKADGVVASCRQRRPKKLHVNTPHRLQPTAN